DTFEYATRLKERKEEVIRLIDEQEKLTEELAKEINAATKLQRVEDIYRPYRKKPRTRETVAKEKGLEPLAQEIYEQTLADDQSEAKKYISEEHELSSVDDVLAGANDILAEWISDEASYREHIRSATWKKGKIETEVKDSSLDEKEVYKMYYEY